MTELGQQMLHLSAAALEDMLKEPVIEELSSLVHNYGSEVKEVLHDPAASELFTYLSEVFHKILQQKKSFISICRSL